MAEKSMTPGAVLKEALIKRWFDIAAAGGKPGNEETEAVLSVIKNAAGRWLDRDDPKFEDIVQEYGLKLLENVQTHCAEYRSHSETKGLIGRGMRFLAGREHKTRSRRRADGNPDDIPAPEMGPERRLEVEQERRLHFEATGKLLGRRIVDDDERFKRMRSALRDLFEMFAREPPSVPVSVYLACLRYLGNSKRLGNDTVRQALRHRVSGGTRREVKATFGTPSGTIGAFEFEIREIAAALVNWGRNRQETRDWSDKLLNPMVRDHHRDRPDFEIDLALVVALWFLTLDRAVKGEDEFVRLGGMPRDVAKLFLAIGGRSTRNFRFALRRLEGQRLAEAASAAGLAVSAGRETEKTIAEFRKTIGAQS
jgi:hypothetical protein